MNFIEIAIFILFFAILSVPIANRFRLPLEVFLVIGSCIISLLPWLPNFEINPKIVFSLFLPPILFYAAYFTSWHDFKNNIRPISLLAFGLVIFTMLVVAYMAKIIFPQFTLAECFLLGAIISPTDAASATSIIKKLCAPRRIVIILEGESLINDATALILFQFSLIAIILGSFSIAHATGQFVVITLGGIAVGLIIAFISEYILQKIHSVPAEITLTFITALTSYIVADHLHVSGVISTVVCGIYFGIRFPELSSSRTRINAKASWDTLIFIINGFAFTLIGLELPIILQRLQYESLASLIYTGITISIIIILARIIWVFFGAYVSRLLFPSISKNDPMPPWSILYILGWCGMRGIISLAAALSIPLYLSPMVIFPHRDLIIFMTYCVVVFTLIIPSFTLPLLLNIFHLTDSENKMKQEALARTRSLEGVIEKLQQVTKNEDIPMSTFDELRRQVERRIDTIKTQLNETPYSTLNPEYQAVKKLTLAAISSEKQTLFKLRKLGEINDEVFHMLLEELDIEEMRANTLRV